MGILSHWCTYLKVTPPSLVLAFGLTEDFLLKVQLMC